MANSTLLVVGDLHADAPQILDEGREMAKVTAQFKDNFDFWSAYKIKVGHFTREEMAELKGMIRKDLMEGPDQIRQGLEVIITQGIVVPAEIDDHMDRYKLWDDFFSVECGEIRAVIDAAVGINGRIKSSIAQAKEEMGEAA